MTLRNAVRRLLRQHRPARSYAEAVRQAGGIGSSVDRGVQTIPTSQIVGSVSRWQNLRTDFFYRAGKRMTQRFVRIGHLMAAGHELPPISVYKLQGEHAEYYVVDGHHRVAMARRLGQDFMDAHVLEIRPRFAEARQSHTLRRVRLFRDATSDDLQAIWKNLQETPMRAGDVICRRGDREDRLYIVHAGSVEVRLGTGPNSMSLYRLGPGDCFGEMALLSGEARSADVVAAEDGSLWALDRAPFEQAVGNSLPLLRAMNRTLVDRLAMATGVIEQAGLTGDGGGAAGLRFGRYRVIAQIGAGGMAVVYSAVNEVSGAAVALKVLPASWGSAPVLRARLEREAQLLQRIDHPGIVQVIEIGEVAERLGGGTYIAMEWLPDALDKLLYARYPEPLQLDRAVFLACSVLDALAAVHASGLIHRDVKPSNIMLRANGEPVLTDFGLALLLQEAQTQQRLTPPNVVNGTADYLAPEIITGQPAAPAADIYALGIVLYEMLAGLVPFAGRDPLQTLRAHCESPVPPLPVEVPVGVREVTLRALAKNPSDRFPSAQSMAEALRHESS